MNANPNAHPEAHRSSTTRIVAISFGDSHSAAIDADGRLTHTLALTLTLTLTQTLTFTLNLFDNHGRLYTFGNNEFGQCCHPYLDEKQIPAPRYVDHPYCGGMYVVGVACGQLHTDIVTSGYRDSPPPARISDLLNNWEADTTKSHHRTPRSSKTGTRDSSLSPSRQSSSYQSVTGGKNNRLPVKSMPQGRVFSPPRGSGRGASPNRIPGRAKSPGSLAIERGRAALKSQGSPIRTGVRAQLYNAGGLTNGKNEGDVHVIYDALSCDPTSVNVPLLPLPHSGKIENFGTKSSIGQLPGITKPSLMAQPYITTNSGRVSTSHSQRKKRGFGGKEQQEQPLIKAKTGGSGPSMFGSNGRGEKASISGSLSRRGPPKTARSMEEPRRLRLAGEDSGKRMVFHRNSGASTARVPDSIAAIYSCGNLRSIAPSNARGRAKKKQPFRGDVRKAVVKHEEERIRIESKSRSRSPKRATTSPNRIRNPDRAGDNFVSPSRAKPPTTAKGSSRGGRPKPKSPQKVDTCITLNSLV